MISSPPRKRCVEESIASANRGPIEALCSFHARSSHRAEKPDFKAAVATLLAVGHFPQRGHIEMATLGV